MASITGVGSSGLNSTSGLRGYGGLASGLDRDTLIENMTYATRSKIAAQKQKKEKYTWTQEAIRNITGKLYDFSNKYMSYSSSTNLLGSKLFSRNQITALGENSKYISVTGSNVSAETLSILGVKSLAKDAQMTTSKNASGQQLKTAAISADLTTEIDADVVSGEAIFIKYGTKTYSLSLTRGEGYDYSTPQKAAESMNKALKNVEITGGKTLADVMEVKVSGDRMTFVNSQSDDSGNTLKLAGSTGDLLKDLGFLKKDESFESLNDSRTIITKAGLEGVEDAKVTQKASILSQFSGKQMSFSYNGTVKWITLDEYKNYTFDASDPDAGLEMIKDDIEKKLGEAFGKNRIKVDVVGGSFTFETWTPDGKGGGQKDTSSVLSITAADRGLIGNGGLLGIQEGASNRLNTRVSIANSGHWNAKQATPDATNPGALANGKMTIKNGLGDEIDLADHGLTWESSINDIINTVNGIKELGIEISYQSNADRFVVKSTEQGASGEINLSGSLSSVLFGKEDIGDGTGGDYTVQDGQDAVIRVKYAGTGEELEISRGSNTISVDGLNVTVKGEFGYNGGTYVPGTEAITFDAQVDTDTTAKAVKEMIDAYNEALTLIHSEVRQKPNRDYAPLTDEQREELSESQIEKWEIEAKKGLLFNDTDVRGLADSLRFIIPSESRAALENMGITVSTNYSDNGKLVFDEEKFKAALQSDPDAVKEAFTKAVEKKEDGTSTEGGLMVKMKTVMDRYASMTGATKGVLVERAGSVYAPTTVLKNGLQTQIDEIDKNLKRLYDKLETEQDRYIAQFTSLERLISQMNSQSGYLSSMFSS